MKLFYIAIILSLLTFSCSEKTTQEVKLEYNVNPKYNENLSLEIDFKYKSDNDGLIKLRYENNSWGDNDIFNCIKNFKVDPKPLSVDFKRDSSLIFIKTTPNSNNRIYYSISQDFKEPLLNKHRYRPIINENYFHILGMRLFMIPEGIFESESSKAKITIHWGDFPQNGVFHSSFGSEKTQDIEVTREELYASFFVGGDFRKYNFKYKEDFVFFVTRGHWKTFNDKDVLKILKETIIFQNEFWKASSTGMFSVSLLPTFEPWTKTSKANSIGGSGFTNSFISFASNNDGTTLKKLEWLYNHELLHKWIGRTIINENEVEQYWFSEGFTDYYAYKLMLKNNKLDIEEFIEILNNEIIIPHYKDETNTIPNSELTFQKYWSKYATYGKLPYRRGLLYAFLIDNQIKKQSDFTKSLDNLMYDILELAKNEETMRFNDSIFKQQLSKYLDSKALSDFEKYIIQGQLIDFDNELLNGLSIEIQDSIPLFRIELIDIPKQLEKSLKL